MTLLVAASNRPALALYERAGFRHRSGFVVARTGRDARFTDLALAANNRIASR